MFRIRIILLSILISGSVLIAFGLYFLNVIHDVSLDRIDLEIRSLGQRPFHAWRLARRWEEMDRSLQFIYGEKRWKDIIVQVRTGKNEVLYRSPHWPEGISEDSFPEYDRRMETPPPLPAHFPESRQRLEHSGRNAGAVDPAGQEPPDDRTGTAMPPPSGILPGRPPGPSHADIIPDRPPPGPPVPIRAKQPFFKTLKADGKTWRIGIMGNPFITILIGMDMAGFHSEAARFRKTFFIALPIALLLLAAGGWLITRRALGPVADITRTAESITAQGLDRRIPPSTGARDEFSRLVDVINDMLDRLENSFKQAVRFSADAAHELKTPLTILQGMLDDAVQHAPDGSDEQRSYGTLIEEVQRLKAIVQKLLILAHADAGQLALNLEPLDISTVIESAIEDVGAIAPGLRLEPEIAPHVMVQADPDLFRQVIQNLTSNAVKFNTEGGLIRFRLEERVDRVLFTISNSGAPIPEADHEKIFHRFYRVDKSRSRTVPGSGLGLSLAREIIHAHGGSLRLDADSGELITFILSLPRKLPQT
ncbi:MAG: HAMP domain-containing protein [Syntrophaceae bacterium]|nr:HAMP domain-containing protein [Syntrophaceae bacterium]